MLYVPGSRRSVDVAAVVDARIVYGVGDADLLQLDVRRPSGFPSRSAHVDRDGVALLLVVEADLRAGPHAPTASVATTWPT